MSETAPAEPQFTLPTPGEKHALLKPFEGTFNATVSLWMGPGDPEVSTGKMVSSFQLNGLFLQQDYSGDPSEGSFPDFAGKGFWGYNSTTSVYQGFWIDTVSDQFQTESGRVDESGKIWEMNSEFELPCVGLMQKRTVITVVDQDHHRMEAFHTMAGQPEAKTMVIEYVRA